MEEPGSKSNPYESPRRADPHGSAQITGRPCAVCNRSIVTSINASWCPACDLAFHADCLGGRTRCTNCQRDFKESAAAVNSQAARQSAAEIQLGRWLVVMCLGILAMGHLLPIGISALLGSTEYLLRNMGGIMIFLFLSVLIYFGFSWAKKVLQLLLVLGIAFNVLVLAALLAKPSLEKGIAAGILTAFIITEILVLCILSLARSVQVFLDQQNR